GACDAHLVARLARHVWTGHVPRRDEQLARPPRPPAALAVVPVHALAELGLCRRRLLGRVQPPHPDHPDLHRPPDDQSGPPEPVRGLRLLSPAAGGLRTPATRADPPVPGVQAHVGPGPDLVRHLPLAPGMAPRLSPGDPSQFELPLRSALVAAVPRGPGVVSCERHRELCSPRAPDPQAEGPNRVVDAAEPSGPRCTAGRVRGPDPGARLDPPPAPRPA